MSGSRAGWLRVVLAMAPVGCARQAGDSCDVATDEFSALAAVVDSSSTIRAEIDFEIGDRTRPGQKLWLCDEDQLTINGREPVETEKADRVTYAVNFDPGLEDRDFRFVLEREGEEETIELVVTLPPAFEIVEPMAEAEISRSNDLMLVWEPAWDSPPEAASLRIELGEDIGMGECLYTLEGDHHYKRLGGVAVPDDGDWRIPASSVASDLEARCRGYYALRRLLPGTYPDALHSGGRVQASVERSVAFWSNP